LIEVLFFFLFFLGFMFNPFSFDFGFFFVKCLIFFSILPLNQLMLIFPLMFLAFGPHSFILLFF
jgi:hypothetical protein